jgi:LacI family transcriptional regulator
MSAPPKHREISEQILSEIAAGRYAAAGRLPTEMQLVKRFQVSRPTIARALRDIEARGLIERRAGSGTYLHTTTSAPQSPRQMGLLVPGLGKTEVFEVICGELASLARAHGVSLLWGAPTLQPDGTDLSEEAALQLCAQFIKQQVIGVFFTPFDASGSGQRVNRKIAELLSKAGIPVVLLDRDIEPFPHRSGFDLVGIDNLAGGCLLAGHLIKLGCQRIAFVTRPRSVPTINARIAGAREALSGHKIEIPPDWVHAGDPGNPAFITSLTAAMRWDAVVCANDLIAAQLMHALERAGIHVPRDLRVVGFDDTRDATLLDVPLTTMRQPCRDIAIAAFHAMTDRIADPTLPARGILLTPQLIVRESCGAYLSGNTRPA